MTLIWTYNWIKAAQNVEMRFKLKALTDENDELEDAGIEGYSATSDEYIK